MLYGVTLLLNIQKTLIFLFLSFKWEDNEQENQETHEIKCKNKRGMEDALMPHLNNQIQLRTACLSDDTRRVTCVVLFKCLLLLVALSCFIFSLENHKHDPVKKC